VGGACGTHGRAKRIVQGFGGKSRKKDHSEDGGVDRRTGSEWILGILAGWV
jgi:hypothetical protein